MSCGRRRNDEEGPIEAKTQSHKRAILAASIHRPPPVQTPEKPFPGMDPYLEQFWLDISTVDCVRSAGANSCNPVARVEERIVFETEGSERHGHPASRSQNGVARQSSRCKVRPRSWA